MSTAFRTAAITAFAALGAANANADLITLDGSGTTNPSKFYWDVMSKFEARAMPPVKMTYRGVGSSTGGYEFVGALNTPSYTAWSDFGSGDIPLTQSYYNQLEDAGRTVAHFPFLLGAMSFFHNIPGLPISGVDGLNMTGCILAKIFKTTITTWDDTEILAINPGLSVPTDQPIYVYHRVYGSSTTFGITSYLHASCPSVWTKDLVGSSITWDDSTYEAQGSGNMAAYLASEEYAIGYIDAGHGHDDGLAEVELENADGLFQSSLEAAERGGIALAGAKALEQGALPSDALKSFANVSFHNMPGNVTWPIVATSYIYVDTNQTTKGSTGALLKAFLTYIISDEGQSLVADYNFVGIPSSMLAVAQGAIDAMDLGMEGTQTNISEWSFETSSSTQKGAGMEPYVISGKRSSWYEYAISNNEGDIEDNTDSMTDNYNALDTRLSSVESSVDSLEDADDDLPDWIKDPQVAIDLAIAALFFGLVGLALGAVALFKVNQFVKQGSVLKDTELTNNPANSVELERPTTD